MDRPVPFLAIRQESRRPAFPWVSCVANATKKEHGITSTIVFTDEARADALMVRANSDDYERPVRRIERRIATNGPLQRVITSQRTLVPIADEELARVC